MVLIISAETKSVEILVFQLNPLKTQGQNLKKKCFFTVYPDTKSQKILEHFFWLHLISAATFEKKS